MVFLNALIINGSRYYKQKKFPEDQSSFLAQDNLLFYGTHFTILKQPGLPD